MELTSWSVLALAAIVAVTLLRRVIPVPRHKPKQPPGPKPWPIIGNLNLVGSIPHQSFHLLSEKYGPIMQLKFGSCPVVVASSPEMAKEFLKTHGQAFASRPALAAGKYTSYNFSDLLWAPYGPYWRQARRIYLNELFSPKRLDSYQYIRVEEQRALVSRLRGLSGTTVVMREHLTRFTLTSTSRMTLGDKYFSESSTGEGGHRGVKLAELQGMLDEWFVLGGVFNIGDWIPWLSFLDLQGYVKRMKALYRKLDRFHDHVIDDHKEKATRRAAAGDKDSMPKDIVDVLLHLADDPALEIKLTTDCIKGLIQDPIAGGTDTSAVTVEWAISELMKHPLIRVKAVEELDGVVGRGRWVEEEDIPQLPYLNAIVKETMRLHPVATLLAPHLSIEDCSVAGYDIAKGTTLFVNVWSIGRDPRCWDEPLLFRPERFLGEKNQIDVKGHHFELLPFGSGQRMCPAYRLGMKMIQSTLANLLHGFDCRLPGGVKPEEVDMEEEYGLTTHRKIPIAVAMEPRFPDHMYELLVSTSN
ncbi:trimethyltridecatetraene synthase-like [Diospyros lotus]|uniref:trimethyltridecatetraene synthase-like n=1 Tax=Diospyros lotus TaxID=55363 RepID=UPI00224E232F|nr:trimethyltridecatetraene synthase-like [Diospyros lotus]